jgi:nucleotide-binding universal stress UspA family protein
MAPVRGRVTLGARKEHTMKQIVIATDGSDAAAHALQQGFALAAETGAGVAVVHVRRTPSTVLGTPYYQEALEDSSLEAEAVMLDARLHASRYGIDADYEVIGGDPSEAIVDFAQARDADLIVIGSRGLGRVAGAILGSVSSAVVHHADRPVLVAKETAHVLEAS